MDREGPTPFDSYAHSYDTFLEKALRPAGEDKNYFARGRLKRLARDLAALAETPRSILDFGCGTGSTTPIFLELFNPERVIGLDDSQALLEIARRQFADARAMFLRPSEFSQRASVDLVFCSAVFHHVAVDDRLKVARHIHSLLRPGGLFALWEHNAWSPAARYVMSRCEFDKGAVPLSAREARELLRGAGFEILRTDFLFIFPRILRFLRPLERVLSRLPLGAQFQVLGRKNA